jgi:NTP pyrophosphatase (non-canonical NTP hydrolase)
VSAPSTLATLAGFQRHIEAVYGARDAARGVDGTFVWFVEEVGELARALKRRDPSSDSAVSSLAASNLREEFADVLAWLSTLASLVGVDLEQAAGKYARGCPRCRGTPCRCPENRPNSGFQRSS